jgi:hypothetical protein
MKVALGVPEPLEDIVKVPDRKTVIWLEFPPPGVIIPAPAESWLASSPVKRVVVVITQLSVVPVLSITNVSPTPPVAVIVAPVMLPASQLTEIVPKSAAQDSCGLETIETCTKDAIAKADKSFFIWVAFLGVQSKLDKTRECLNSSSKILVGSSLIVWLEGANATFKLTSE